MKPEPILTLNVDPRNPGQFLACCGLLELADRLWNAAEGWFDPTLTTFLIATEDDHPPSELLRAIADAPLTNTMNAVQVQQLEALRATKTKNLTQADEDQKKELEKMWRERPLILGGAFDLTIDWFVDTQAKGNRFKTWAGQQSVIEIARNMKQPVDEGRYDDVDPRDWIQHSEGTAVTFNFDADATAHSSPLDVGFSLDPLKISSKSRPLLELLAFIGLQRFRPKVNAKENIQEYAVWTTPLLPEIAAAVCAGGAAIRNTRAFSFPLLYRTQYLKSFLPAQPKGDE